APAPYATLGHAAFPALLVPYSRHFLTAFRVESPAFGNPKDDCEHLVCRRNWFPRFSFQPRRELAPLPFPQTFPGPAGLFLALLQTLKVEPPRAFETAEQNLQNPLPCACLPCR